MLTRLLFVPDVHRPYHDKRAWRLLLRAARAFRPHRIVVLGDFGDFYSISSHSKDPNRARLLDQELSSVAAGLTDLERIGAGERYFIAGNHEHRLERYLCDRAPELYNVVRLDALLELQARGWHYTAYRDHLKIGRLYVTHDTGTAGSAAHVRARSTFEASVVIGHTHRIGVHYAASAKGKSSVGAMFGWLGDAAKAAPYAHRVNVRRDWHLGFGIGYMTSSGVVHLQACPIIDYSVMVEGRLLR
jgi:predicted phosphodiesterase